MRLSDENLRGRTIIGADGQVIGEINALFLNSDSWRVESLQVKLGKDIADRLGADRSLFHVGALERQFLKRDLAATRVDFTRARASVNKALDPSRIGGGFVDLASHLFGSMGEMFHGWAPKSEEALAFNTCEISGPGKLTCTECGSELHLERPSRIPPCPKCHKTDFRKSY